MTTMGRRTKSSAARIENRIYDHEAEMARVVIHTRFNIYV